MKTPASRRLLVIGLDAGSPELITRWSASGDLPNIRHLMRGGQTRPVQNPYGLEAGSVWPVFHTGLLPGRQPQYDGRRFFDPHDYSTRWYGPGETATTIWATLSNAGVRCLLIDPPYLLLDESINGTMIVDWGSHVPADGSQFRLQTHPASLRQAVLDLVGPDPAGGIMCDRIGPETVADHRRFLHTYLRRIELKGRLAAHMLQDREWDVALVASSDLHCTGHHLWHVNDPGHPRYSARLERKLGEPLRQCYRAFDSSLSGILGAVGPETTVALIGTHGMGPSYSGTGLLDRILCRLDAGSPPHQLPSCRLRGVLRSAWTRIPTDVRGRMHPLRRHIRGLLRPPRFIDDHASRQFFEVLANNATGGIRFNIRGREARGILSRAEAQQLAHYLTDELKKVMNCETGQPLITDTILTSNLYSGAYLDHLPDLLVTWNRNAPIRRVGSATIGELVHEYTDNRSGDHTPGGICVVAGSMHRLGTVGATVRIEDFAPSIAGFFGVELDAHDGRSFDLGAC